LPPGEYPAVGDECTFDPGHDALGRPVANEVKIIRRAEPQDATHAGMPYIQRGSHRQYIRADLTAEDVQSLRSRARERAEEIFTIPGELDV
jgi:hypothetical protein